MRIGKEQFEIKNGTKMRMLNRLRHRFAERVLYGRFPYAYAHYYYWKHLGKELSYRNPQDINEKMFWLGRFWQDPRIVQYADKLAVREYVKGLGLDSILTKVYAVYDSPEDIDFSKLPQRFVLKTNHCGGGINMVLCKNKQELDQDRARQIIADGLKKVIGISTCEYHYQYIVPKAYAEEYIGDANDERLEIQFFCFNGTARHILVRNDLGDAAAKSFAISYDMDWNRVKDRKREDMSIDIPRPAKLDEMISVANKLAAPFPHVRVDLYYVDEVIYFGELTFSTSGNVLWNYTDEVIKRWGEELALPPKLKTKWNKVYKSYAL